MGLTRTTSASRRRLLSAGPGKASGRAVTFGRAEARRYAHLHPRHEPRRAPDWVQALVVYVVAPAVILAIAIAGYVLLNH